MMIIRNGFRTPFHYKQVFSWIYFIINSSSFFCLTHKTINNLIVFLIYGLINLIVLIIAIIIMYSDPTDPIFRKEKEKQIFCQTNKLTYNLQISKSMDFCIFCCSNVDSSSKHCKLCDRCVNGFDHHCDWINNCIGKQNYTKFIILLLSILIYSIYSSIFEFYSLYQVIVVSPSEFLIVVIFSSIFGLVNSIVIILDAYLIIMHIYLKYLNMTTYEFIFQNLIKKSENTKTNKIKRVNEISNITEISQTNILKNRNKLEPEILIEKLKEFEDKNTFKMEEEDKRIIINDFNNKIIFKPIIDQIYIDKNKTDTANHFNLTSKNTLRTGLKNFNL